MLVFLIFLNSVRNGKLSCILYSQISFAHKGIAAQGGKKTLDTHHASQWTLADLGSCGTSVSPLHRGCKI